MKQIICEMCGSHELVKEDGLFVCQYCGCKYTLEEARKMMIEGNVDVSGSTVKVDDSKELENLYQIARRAKDAQDVDSAVKYYDMILIKDPDSWEAAFYAAYYKALSCRVGEITSSAQLLSRSFNSVINLIKTNITDKNARVSACSEIFYKIQDLFTVYYKNITDYCLATNSKDNNKLIEFNSSVVILISCFYSLSNVLEENFSDDEEIMKLSVESWKIAVKIHTSCADNLPNKSEHLRIINSYKSKICKYDPEYENSTDTSQSSGGCYVATAVYGSYDCPQVWTLRRFRDYTLAESILGRAFIRVYYAISPTVVKYFGDTVWFNKLFRGVLNKMVAKLNETGVKDTPYEDRIW